MAYTKQEFENKKTVLTAEMLQLMEDGIIDGDVSARLLDNTALADGAYNVFFIKRDGKAVPVFEPTTTTASYYFYDVSNKGLLSPNDMYKRTKLYSQGGQDGTIYKGLSFRGNGAGTITIKNVATGAGVGTMTWDKVSLLKPHDNSMSTNIEYSNEDIAFTTTWELNKTYAAGTGLVGSGTRAICPHISLTNYKNIKLTITSCNFIVCCYDSSNNYLGQISTSLNGMVTGTGQWLPKGTQITEKIIFSCAPNTDNIALCAYNNEEPTYSLSYSEEDCYMYSNIYNSYSSSTTDKHIGECCVYNVVENEGTWTNSLVQLIKIGFINDANYWSPSNEARPYGNFVVDAENKYLYAFTMYTSKGLTYWYKFNLPSVTSGEWNDTYGCYVCTLNIEDIVDSWTTTHQNYVQGACVHNKLIYSTEGFNGTTGTNVARMRIIDPEKKKEIATFHFYADDDPVEPEFIDFYNGICYYGSVQTMYILELL